MKKPILLILPALALTCALWGQTAAPRKVANFNGGWRFHLGDIAEAKTTSFDDQTWRVLRLPHDWSIEGTFSPDAPATVDGGALPGGVGWYRKTFTVPASSLHKKTFIDFDGVYRNSEVWINGNLLGKRPYGYSSFEYELTPYLKIGKPNVIAVRADNSDQPNSRWYSGSGIFRNVWLKTTGALRVDHWGTFVTTPKVGATSAEVRIETRAVDGRSKPAAYTLTTRILDMYRTEIVRTKTNSSASAGDQPTMQTVTLPAPKRWSVDRPYLYTAVSEIRSGGNLVDRYETPFGVRTIRFDREKGFFLNNERVVINGVCNHHDLGALGSAINKRALERQLEILKKMGCNGIRTSHNPPAPELLDLCDRMGFIVMDEAFDMWKKKKKPFDYSIDFDQWHERDLQDMILRDRNHPCVAIWSIGNEIPEQGDTTGTILTKELCAIVRKLDTTRPIGSANDAVWAGNYIIKSGAMDLVGINYHHQLYSKLPEMYPKGAFFGSETVSALESRGHYDMPADSIRRWPVRWDSALTTGNPDQTCSAYDNCSAPWGSTHEETWKSLKALPYMAGQFIWTGFDYLGEPTPYHWPSRSSYFGIVDMAGFPKDVYYMYQSEWTSKPVLHLLPHWNWTAGRPVDVWAYFNQADEVELFLNGQSLGSRTKKGDDLHVSWRVPFAAGTLKAVSRSNGKTVKTEEIHTAGAPAKIRLTADRRTINGDGDDLSFVKVEILDQNGNLVPDANARVAFSITGEADLAGVDNGEQTNHDSFKARNCKAFNGLCLAIVRARKSAGKVTLRATAAGLQSASVGILIK